MLLSPSWDEAQYQGVTFGWNHQKGTYHISHGMFKNHSAPRRSAPAVMASDPILRGKSGVVGLE